MNLNLLSVVFVVSLRGLLNLGILFMGKVVYCSFVGDTWGLDEIAMKLVRESYDKLMLLLIQEILHQILDTRWAPTSCKWG